MVTGLETVCQALHKSASDLDPMFVSVDLSQLHLTQPFLEDSVSIQYVSVDLDSGEGHN